MDKPITVARHEFINNLAELVNRSGLPAFVIRAALANMDSVLAQMEEAQLLRDSSIWNDKKEVGDG